MMGQRDLYNPEALAEFEKALSLGCTYTLACAAAGWSYRAYREWMVAAEKGEPKYSALPAVVARARANRAKRCSRCWKRSRRFRSWCWLRARAEPGRGR